MSSIQPLLPRRYWHTSADYYYTLKIWDNDLEEKKELESRGMLIERHGLLIKDYFWHGGTWLFIKKTRLGCAMGMASLV